MYLCSSMRRSGNSRSQQDIDPCIAVTFRRRDARDDEHRNTKDIEFSKERVSASREIAGCLQYSVYHLAAQIYKRKEGKR